MFLLAIPPGSAHPAERARATTSEYTPRLRSRLAREQQLAQDAIERGWPREVERHNAIADRIRGLLADLGESTEPGPDDHC
ncbi:hypothetical protein [Streptomyces rapamycinicus]|uniref:Uncharacterized protein n=2 Tax=Streptomyces rapamycinicus TaxID=1226757 RepID=A0A0A0N579_STRRN|nr:hypothetical protein [Streptomyces rapamycinicus]AGP51961.1 hypothetical protein M271_01620 [Streptomyces rapamycinicus NRRL 5491]MBB4779381.1 hypothetical protein [Streptomyces rapamycinicus]RLV75956.1 hypothetical protein D3C57_142060 [Streptomyces rapamycinicus NRRL 5491]UTP28160.1 hypothetical protein LIV37_01595 [Streptomyces rapamycinicus NRRL 5491]